MKQTWLWYSRMLQLLIQNPLLLPANKLLLAVPQYDKIHPLKKPLQLVACILFRNKFLSKEFTKSITKIILQQWCNLSFKKNCYKWPLLEKQTNMLQNRSSGANHSHLEFQYQQSTLLLQISPFKESCLMWSECWAKLMNISNFWMPNLWILNWLPFEE